MSTREELTRHAEKSLRQGRIDEAIARYQDLAYLEPVDWGLVKLLADLLERAGQREAAARQFTRWADHLFAEGFHSKAAALYKKVLKLDATDERALWNLGEVSIELRLRADARVAFQRVLDVRQRRGDAAGAAAARERLASLDAQQPVSPPVAPAPFAMPVRPAGVPVPQPAAAVPAPAPAQEAPEVTFAAVVPVEHAPPSEPPDVRLARLRREAGEADLRRASDAHVSWAAVLDADPGDVAVRVRLVQAALDRDDIPEAARLAARLDPAEGPALALLVEIAHRSGRSADVGRLVSDRIHAGAPLDDVLAPLDVLAPQQPGAARAALVAAVETWVATGQPGHAVTAFERADARGLLQTSLYLRWVEISVDAGLPGLSRAQRALAHAYLRDRRLAEARAVAEDVFLREGGADPSRALLLEILDHQGDPDPHRVLVNLLTPPSDVTEPDDAAPAFEPAVAADAAFAVPVAPEPDPASFAPEARLSGILSFDWADLLGRDVDHLGRPLAPEPAARSATQEHAAFEPEPQLEPEPEAEPEAQPEPARAHLAESMSSALEPDAIASVSAPATVLPEPGQGPTPTADDALEVVSDGAGLPEPEATGAEPPAIVGEADAELPRAAEPEAPGTGLRPRIGDLRAQPMFAEEAPLQPSFSMPTAWLTDATSSVPDDAPRRRAPEDDFFFTDDATPARWATRPRLDQAGDDGRLEPTPALDQQPAPPPAPSSPFPEPGTPFTALGDPSTEPGPPPPAPQVVEEVDLTRLLEELQQWDPALPELRPRSESVETAPAVPLPLIPPEPRLDDEPPALAVDGAEAPPDQSRQELDAVFADLQRHADERTVAEQQLAAGRVFLAAGLVSEAARAFDRASLEPRTRFEAALALAELHSSRGQLPDAVAWYEQAAAAPVPDAAVKRAVLYDLAEALETLGQSDRALGVLLDLLSQVEDYRDARARVDRLLRVDAGG